MKNKKREFNKRGLSTIVVTLILVVLSLVAVGVVWAVISNLLKTGEQQSTSSFGQIFLNLKVQNVNLKTNGDVDVTVQRNSGTGDLKAINFIVSDGTNSKVIKKTTSLQELGTQTFTLTYSELGAMAVKEVSIAPIINSNGQESVGSVADKYTSKMEALNTESSAGTSCKSLLAGSRGDGVYWINPDGNNLMKVYCDMTTDGGGWPLAAICRPEDNPNYPTFNPNVPASKCWKVDAVGSVLDPASTTTVKLSDTIIKMVLTNGDKTTRGHWTQQYRYSTLSPVDVFIYNLINDPSQWSSNGGGATGKLFSVKYSYGDSWTPLSTLSVGCASPSNGWSNAYYTETRGESCGPLGAWDAGCEAGPSSSHCCACQTYDERANVIVYVR